MKRKKEKGGWAKWVSRDDAYNMGKRIGMRRTLELLAEDYAFDEGTVAWLFEEWILKNKEWDKDILKKSQ